MKNLIKMQGHQIELQLNVLVFQQGDFYIAFCPSLNLSSYGDSIEDAKVGFDEAVSSYLEEGEENGTLHEDLTKNGWVFNIHNHKNAIPPALVELDIPAGVLKAQFNESRSVAFS